MYLRLYIPYEVEHTSSNKPFRCSAHKTAYANDGAVMMKTSAVIIAYQRLFFFITTNIMCEIHCQVKLGSKLDVFIILYETE